MAPCARCRYTHNMQTCIIRGSSLHLQAGRLQSGLTCAVKGESDPSQHRTQRHQSCCMVVLGALLYTAVADEVSSFFIFARPEAPSLAVRSSSSSGILRRLFHVGSLSGDLRLFWRGPLTDLMIRQDQEGNRHSIGSTIALLFPCSCQCTLSHATGSKCCLPWLMFNVRPRAQVCPTSLHDPVTMYEMAGKLGLM